MEQELLTVAEAAKRLRLHMDTARRFVREGKLPATKIGQKYLISSKAIEEFIAKGAVVGKPAGEKPE